MTRWEQELISPTNYEPTYDGTWYENPDTHHYSLSDENSSPDDESDVVDEWPESITRERLGYVKRLQSRRYE